MKKVYCLSWGHQTPHKWCKRSVLFMECKNTVSGKAANRTEIFLALERAKCNDLLWVLVSAPTTMKDIWERHFWVREEEVSHLIDLPSFPVNMPLSWYWMLHAGIFQDCCLLRRGNLRWQQLSTAWGEGTLLRGRTKKATASTQHEAWLWEVHIWCLNCEHFFCFVIHA